MDFTAFTDTDDYNILAAYALGIVNGIGNKIFKPDGTITRQEATTMLHCIAQALGTKKAFESGVSFSDAEDIAKWPKESIIFISFVTDPTSGDRVMGGTGNNNFSPLNSYTRE